MTIYTHLNKLVTFPVLFCLPGQSLENKLKSPITISNLLAMDLSHQKDIHQERHKLHIFFAAQMYF